MNQLRKRMLTLYAHVLARFCTLFLFCETTCKTNLQYHVLQLNLNCLKLATIIKICALTITMLTNIKKKCEKKLQN